MLKVNPCEIFLELEIVSGFIIESSQYVNLIVHGIRCASISWNDILRESSLIEMNTIGGCFSLSNKKLV